MCPRRKQLTRFPPRFYYVLGHGFLYGFSVAPSYFLPPPLSLSRTTLDRGVQSGGRDGMGKDGGEKGKKKTTRRAPSLHTSRALYTGGNKRTFDIEYTLPLSCNTHHYPSATNPDFPACAGSRATGGCTTYDGHLIYDAIPIAESRFIYGRFSIHPYPRPRSSFQNVCRPRVDNNNMRAKKKIKYLRNFVVLVFVFFFFCSVSDAKCG